jgi:general secretion pathway protein F
MAQFRYIAVEPSSEKIEGRIEAASKSAVVERLHASGQVPIRIDEVGSFSFAHFDVGDLIGARRVSRRALSLMTSQLATLLHAGLALHEALTIMAELFEQPAERESLKLLLERISGGTTLADAMLAQPKVFPGFYVSMIRAGEAGASLDQVLARLAEFLERSETAREYIKSALIYPLIVAITCCASIAVLFIFVVPRFRPLFEQAGDALPRAARLLLAVSDLVQNYWWLGILAMVGVVLAGYWQFKNNSSRYRLERWLMKTPIVGNLIVKTEVARFSRTLGTLLKNGVSLLSALAITRETVGNRVFFEALSNVIDQVKTGKGLAGPLSQTKAFPPLAVHLIRVGEESGRQEEMFFRVADIFEAEIRRGIDRLLALLVPALTVVLGLIVAGVIGSILTAILSVYDLAV